MFARDRADLGPAHAAEHAAREAANYAHAATARASVLAELQTAWEREARCLDRLERDEPRRDALREIVALRRDQAAELAAVEDRYRQARTGAQQTRAGCSDGDAVIAGDTERYRDQLLAEWDADRGPARAAAAIVNAGPGPLGLRLPRGQPGPRGTRPLVGELAALPARHAHRHRHDRPLRRRVRQPAPHPRRVHRPRPPGSPSTRIPNVTRSPPPPRPRTPS